MKRNGSWSTLNKAWWCSMQDWALNGQEEVMAWRHKLFVAVWWTAIVCVLCVDGQELTEKSIFFFSWLTALGSVCLSTDTDSPVRMDWSTLSVVDRIDVSRMSAGTLSPTRIREDKPQHIHSVKNTSYFNNTDFKCELTLRIIEMNCWPTTI